MSHFKPLEIENGTFSTLQGSDITDNFKQWTPLASHLKSSAV